MFGGGGGSPQVTKSAPPPAPPSVDDAVADKALADRRRTLMARGGARNTIATSPMGLAGTTTSSGVLGNTTKSGGY